MVERARGLSGVLRERQRSLARALDAAADADVVSTLEAEGARLAEELASAATEAADLAPEQDGLLAAESALVAELEDHLASRGDGSELRRAEEAVTVAKGQLASLEHALERDRRTLDQLIARQGATERRAAVLEGEDHELGERLAETEQNRHRLQAARAGTEDDHRAATRRVEVAEEALRQAEQEHARSQARADALERALDEARGAAGAELLAGVDGVVGTLLDLVEVDSGWEEAFEAAAGASLAAVVVSGSEPARAACPACARVGPPAPFWRSPVRVPACRARRVRRCPRAPSRSAAMSGPEAGGPRLSRARRGAGHAAPRVVLRAAGMVRGYRSGAGPS